MAVLTSLNAILPWLILQFLICQNQILSAVQPGALKFQLINSFVQFHKCFKFPFNNWPCLARLLVVNQYLVFF